MLPITAISRRRFISLTGLGLTGLLASKAGLLPAGELPFLAAIPSSDSDLEIALTATQSHVQLLPGQPTEVLKYQGQVLTGDPARLQTLEDSYLGPVMRLRTGERVRIHFNNHLSEETIIHWHGLHVPEEFDGHPRYTIDPGETYIYDFEVLDRAGSYWFHPHPHGRTAPQVYRGLAGLFLVSDDEEKAAGLPSGDRDVPLVIQDRVFDANNQLVYFPGTMTGFLGDTILVNGQPNFTLPVARERYRLRLWNGSNSRIYKLAWKDSTPLTVIATDGGLLSAPVLRDYVTLAPGERVELLVDFRVWPPGTSLVMVSLSFSGSSPGITGTLPDGSEFPVMAFQVSDMQHTVYLPLVVAEGSQGVPVTYPAANLSTLEKYQPSNAVNAGEPRRFYLYRQHMDWTINGRVFEMQGVATDEIVQLDTQEIWEFANASQHGMGMSQMAHPMHVHGLQFQVLSRQPPTDPTQRANWQTVKDGYVDDGWKDTILLMPGERVQIQLAFNDHTGLFLYHCHNLEHEDMGMMRNYQVRADNQ